MLFNISYNNKEITRKIDLEVGNPYSLPERFKMKGIGSPRLIIEDCSIQINNLLILYNSTNYGNIEIRPKGIIVGFRSLLESYALVIPYYKLSLYKGKSEQYSIYRDNYFIKIQARAKEKSIHKFMSRLIDLKAENTPLRIEDL
jgi:hypothetical protein